MIIVQSGGDRVIFWYVIFFKLYGTANQLISRKGTPDMYPVQNLGDLKRSLQKSHPQTLKRLIEFFLFFYFLNDEKKCDVDRFVSLSGSLLFSFCPNLLITGLISEDKICATYLKTYIYIFFSL